MIRLVFAILLSLTACAPLPPPQGAMAPVAPLPGRAALAPGAPPEALSFAAIADRMEPLVERECRRRLPRGNCDFMIVLDTRPGLAPNAFQTVDRATGRPVLGFTLALLDDVRNADELAFVFGHEAAHHILGHLPRREASALGGALILGTLASLGGADPTVIREAQSVGAQVGARRFAPQFELEADALGAQLARAAGFDAERGALYFTRLPDPGNRFLASHPPNAQRMEAVRASLAR